MKCVMQIPLKNGLQRAFRTFPTVEYGSDGYPVGGWRGGRPGQIGTATPGNYPWTDLLDEQELQQCLAWDRNYDN